MKDILSQEAKHRSLPII